MIFCNKCKNCVKIADNANKCKVCNSDVMFSGQSLQSEYYNVDINDQILRNISETRGNVTNAICPKCEYEKALFKEVQTRSADEPMTIFYKCIKCQYNWKQN